MIKNQYQELINSIGILIQEAKKQAYIQVNSILVKTYREIGRYVVEYEQKGKEKAEYGSKLFDRLSKDLKLRYGSGFNRSNLMYIRLMYLKYPISATLSHQLTRSHYKEFLKLENELERSFYEKQCIQEKWSVRELIRTKNSALFQRLALSKDIEGIYKLAKEGYIIKNKEDIIKDPYILEFLGIQQNSKYSESDLEKKIIDNLQKFIMELGNGFTFVASQYRVQLANNHFYIDLVFYHRILKCFVLIDLKIKEVHYSDIGQMNMYLNYFKKEEMTDGDNEPIGIVLAKEKDHTTVEYALGGINNQLFVSKYQLYLPNKKDLQEKFNNLVEGF